MKLQVHVPRVFLPLWQPARYKGAHGGRGSGKSHDFAEQLIIRMTRQQTRAVGIRQVQNSIKESVHQLLASKIESLGLRQWFNVQKDEIEGPHGSLCIFKGMQHYNAVTIKSLEGVDVAWVEEAQTLSDVALRTLRPTIRKPGSELWFSWNPLSEDDPVDKFLRGANPPQDAIVIEANWQDNPWFPDELRAEMELDYESDAEMAAHVWGGDYLRITEGAYYAKLIAQAEREGRLGDFPHVPGRPVQTSWDIGVDDYTAIWFWQTAGAEATVIDYYEVSGDGAPEIIEAALPELVRDPVVRDARLEVLGRDEPYRFGPHWFPHDVKMREWGGGAKSRILTLKELGVDPIKIGVATKPEDRIAAARQLLPVVRFNTVGKAGERVKLGLKRLRAYRRKENRLMPGVYGGPQHDEASHAADAFGEFAINSPLRVEPAKPAPIRPGSTQLIAAPDMNPNVQQAGNGVHIGMSVDEIFARIKAQQQTGRQGRRW